MNATQTAAQRPAATAAMPRMPMIGVLRVLLLGEAVLGLWLAIFLSGLAPTLNPSSEETLRFVAGFAFVFAIVAAVTARGARRRRGWSWTLAAVLQLVLAIGTGIATFVTEWQPAYLAAFALAAVVMLVLSTSSVRRGLGQE